MIGGLPMNIFVNVINQKMIVSSCIGELVAGTQQFVKFQFNMDEAWGGLVTFAQFCQGEKAYNHYLDEENCVYLPAEIEAGSFTLMLYGSYDKVIGTTNYLTFKVNKNMFVSDAQSTEISTSLYNQLVDKVSMIENRINDIGFTEGVSYNKIQNLTDEQKMVARENINAASVYLGSGDMPEGYDFQIDLSGETNIVTNAITEYTNNELPTCEAVKNYISFILDNLDSKLQELL